ncbi:MAG: plasmid pRiA4b ORF-3 family protein, partial [Propionivibrio sp.]
KLHDVIQAVMGWSDCHLHEFEIGGERYGIPDPDFGWGEPVRSERRMRLITALNGKKSFRYTYDFGDNWEHRMKVEKVLPPDSGLLTALCLAGANACPPDDVGGAPGYIDFVDAVSNPDHPEHDEMIEWFGSSFDPAAFDLAYINTLLQKIKL